MLERTSQARTCRCMSMAPMCSFASRTRFTACASTKLCLPRSVPMLERTSQARTCLCRSIAPMSSLAPRTRFAACARAKSSPPRSARPRTWRCLGNHKHAGLADFAEQPATPRSTDEASRGGQSERKPFLMGSIATSSTAWCMHVHRGDIQLGERDRLHRLLLACSC